MRLIYSKCERCGKEKGYKYKSHVKRFCSYACSNVGKQKGETVKVICECCGKEFELLASAKRSREKQGNPVKYCSIKCNAKARTKAKIVNCLYCNKEIVTTRQKYCSTECAGKSRVGTKIVNKRVYSANGWYENGYKVINHEGKPIKEHIKIMEDHIGRKLKKDEVVHHINEIKDDNRLENLQLMTRSEHSSHHRRKDVEEGKELFGRKTSI